jgi:hypothetical protein
VKKRGRHNILGNRVKMTRAVPVAGNYRKRKGQRFREEAMDPDRAALLVLMFKELNGYPQRHPVQMLRKDNDT